MKISCVFVAGLSLLLFVGCNSSRRVSEMDRSRVDWSIDHRIDAAFDSLWRAEWNGRGDWEWVRFDCRLDTVQTSGEVPVVSFTRVRRSTDLSAKIETRVADSLGGRAVGKIEQECEQSARTSRDVSSAKASGVLMIVFFVVVILYVYYLIRRR